MLRHPVQLTSLEEDFKKLGLLQEEGAEAEMTQSGAGTPAPQLKRGPDGKPAPNKTGARDVGANSEGDSDEGKDGNTTVPGHEGAVPPKASLPTTPGAQKESITGGDSRRQRLRGESEEEDGEEDDDEKKSKKKDDDDEDEKDDDKDESVELSGSTRVVEAITRLRGERTESRRSSRRAAKTESKQAPKGGLDKVSALIEDVNQIMESIDDARRSDAVRAFANSSIISEMLARGFAGFAESYEDQELQGAAEAFAEMSEDAASIAHAIEEGEELDAEALQDEFRAQMDALMDGLDLYSDVVEADSELEEGDEPEEVEEEEETEGETVDEETDDEEVEEEVEVEATRATGGIASQRTESYFRGGKAPAGKAKMKKEAGN